MAESLEPKKASLEPGETSPDYGGKTFPNEITELSFLQRLQTTEQIDGIKWDPNGSHFRRLQFLENKKRVGPTPEQRERYNELTRLRNENDTLWSEESRKEFIELQKLMDSQNPSPRFKY